MKKKMLNPKLLFIGLLLVIFSINQTDAQDPWSKLTDMPTARGVHAIGTIQTKTNTKFYIIGGHDGEKAVSTVEEYNTATDTWQKVSDMTFSRSDFSGCSMGGKIYAIGGWSAPQTLNVVEQYDPVTDTWTSKSSMLTDRWGHATCTVNGKIYIIGGATGWRPIDKIYETIEEYDPATNTWTTRASIPTPRWLLSCSVVDGKIYAIGGFNSGPVSAVEEYDPATDTWTTKSNMPTERWGLTTGAAKGKIYAIGGGDTYPASGGYKTVEEYDPVTDSWTTKSPVPEGQLGSACGVANGKVYLIGGIIDIEDPYPDVWVYDPLLDAANTVNNNRPGNLHLHHYPNPFSQSTTFSYSLSRSEFVTLKLYNFTGQEIEVLVNTFQTAGDYQIRWSADGFPGGVYFCNLQTNEFSEIKKLLLQK